MPATLLQFLTRAALVVAEHRPIVVVEFFDDLKCPSPVQDVAAHELVLDPIGDLAVPSLTQFLAGFAEQQVRMPHQLVKRIQLAACTLDPLEGFSDGADGFDRRVVDVIAHRHRTWGRRAPSAWWGACGWASALREIVATIASLAHRSSGSQGPRFGRVRRIDARAPTSPCAMRPACAPRRVRSCRFAPGTEARRRTPARSVRPPRCQR